MILRDIYFPPALGASGVQGFFGDKRYPEYKHSRIVNAIWGNVFKDMAFVAKTATVSPNAGNVKLNGFAFKKLLPGAIYPMPFKKAALNAVGLSNPGFENLLSYGIWQSKSEPFMLSFMPIRKKGGERITETRDFVILLKKHLPKFMAKFALQVNFSCPNIGHDQRELIGEASQILDILSELEVPLVPKINPVLLPQIALQIMEHKYCDALCFSNSIPYGEFAKEIDWSKYSVHGRSPLVFRGYPSGGLSGAPIFPVVKRWLTEFSKLKGNVKPIIAGGGVMTKDNVRVLCSFPNVKAISIGSVAFIKPWEIKSIIRECYASLMKS
jgi:dihydroorotate dehydrogenase